MIEINCPSCLSSNILEDRQVDRDIDCTTCGATFLVEKVILEDEEAEEAANEVVEVIPEAAEESSSNLVEISTGAPSWEYDTIDTIFVIDTLDKKFFSSTSPNLAFEGAKTQLKNQVQELGGDAVINCKFDYRISAGHGIFGVMHDLEIFAYGTVVKRV